MDGEKMLKRIIRAVQDGVGCALPCEEEHLCSCAISAKTAARIVVEETCAFLESVHHVNTAEMVRRSLSPDAKEQG